MDDTLRSLLDDFEDAVGAVAIAYDAYKLTDSHQGRSESLMVYWTLSLLALVAPIVPLSRAFDTQERELVRGRVHSVTGDSISNARVRARASGVDTIVRADGRGRFAVLMPHGAALLNATMLGFAPDSVRVNVTGADSTRRGTR